MNVLAITSSYPRYEGDPTAPFVESITRAVARRGHTIHLLLPETNRWNRPPSDGSIHFHRYRYTPLRSWTPWGFSESLEGGVRIRRPLYALAPIVGFSALRAARSLATRHAIDVVHVHWVVPNGPIGALAARGRALPLVVTLHGSDVGVSERSTAIGHATRWTFRTAAAVTAPSLDLLERARRLGAHDVLERIPYGADVGRFDQSPEASERTRALLGVGPEDVLVAGIGRLVPVKGFAYLIEAYARAAVSLPGLRLVVVGDGDGRDDLSVLTRRLRLEDRILFTGMAAPDEIPSYLAAADIVVVPSVHHEGYVDGLPNVALEAMAAGKPLVASRVGGLPEIVRPGETGLLVAERDSEALARAIETLARDPGLRAAMGDAGRRTMLEEMSWDVVGERFESVFGRVTGT